MVHIQPHPPEPDLFGSGMGLPPVNPAFIRPTPIRAGMTEEKTREAFKTISETAELLALPQHVLRFWESKFPSIKPLKLKGGRRYYRPQDIEALLTIKQLLYKEGYTIKGARRAITQARRHKEPVMTEEKLVKKTGKRKPELEDTPLFALLAPAPAAKPPVVAVAVPPPPAQAAPPAALSAKREELRTIHSELLQLREMIAALPPLTPA